MEVLHPSSATADPCAPQIALFGLKGPTVMSGSVLDVEATGSLGKQRRDRLN